MLFLFYLTLFGRNSGNTILDFLTCSTANTYGHFYSANSNKFIEKLRGVAKGETILDFQDQAHYFTLDVICGDY